MAESPVVVSEPQVPRETYCLLPVRVRVLVRGLPRNLEPTVGGFKAKRADMALVHTRIGSRSAVFLVPEAALSMDMTKLMQDGTQFVDDWSGAE